MKRDETSPYTIAEAVSAATQAEHLAGEELAAYLERMKPTRITIRTASSSVSLRSRS